MCHKKSGIVSPRDSRSPTFLLARARFGENYSVRGTLDGSIICVSSEYAAIDGIPVAGCCGLRLAA